MATETIKAWQCIGCGRLEGEPHTCIGVCQDRRVELVDAAAYAEVVALLRQIATTTPREAQWERTYREMQRRAREMLGMV